ncbi:MAG: Dna2/Cas4 domain-containing protein [Anaerolineales bacterium]|nr:MAG: Dna2/Cas4 domain-containing protein [Anaerolineales bacterium]
MKTIRASEIGSYLFCQRAWWYQSQGFQPDNQVELASGQRLHEKHAGLVAKVGCLRVLAYTFIVMGILLIIINASLHFLS